VIPHRPPGRAALTGLATLATCVVLTVVAAPAAGAHGVGTRSDLPLPFALFAWGAAAAVVASFLILGVLWKDARLPRLAAGRPLPAWTARGVAVAAPAVAALATALAVAVVVAGFGGSDNPAVNLATITVFIVFWVGFQVLQVLAGDVWGGISPIAWAGRLAPDRTEAQPGASPTHWPAVAVLAGFLWLELGFHLGPEPRTVAIFAVIYFGLLAAGAWRYGRAWLTESEGFGVLFRLLAAISPLARGGDGTLRLRPPLSGLATVTTRPGTLALVLVVLGGTTFDGLSGSQLWSDAVGRQTGWTATVVNTIGMAFVIALVTTVYLLAARATAGVVGEATQETAEAFAPSLVPIVFGYAIAHYFSLLVLDGQRFLALLSDPFNMGWDLFGTATWTPNLALVTPDTIAWVQAAAIVVGHVAGVIAAHDRALERYPVQVAVRSQYPMLVAMVAYSVTGLWLLQAA
jgi:hypothetical protein